MLDEYKQILERRADSMLDGSWRKANKNDLLRKYVEIADNKPLAGAYMSAILCRYWNLVLKFYYANDTSITPETAYDWLMMAVSYAVTMHKWTDPESKLYNDPNGPDKVVNRCMLCEKQTFYQQSNYDQEKANHGAASIDEMLESVGDQALPETLTGDVENDLDTTVQIIKDEFSKKNYFCAFVVDGIVNYDSFQKTADESGVKCSVFSERKLIKHLRELDSNYINTFSRRFGFEKPEVEYAVQCCKSLTPDKAYRQLSYSLDKLRHSKYFRKETC